MGEAKLFSPFYTVSTRHIQTTVPEKRLELQNRAIRRCRKGQQPALEAVLSEWVHSRQLARQCITVDVMRQKAVRLHEEINYSRTEDSKLGMKFTVGWLSKFQKRWNLRSRRMHGESGDADMESVRDCLPSLASLVQSYQPNDEWNADETGLYYQMPPDRTISHAALPGRKKAKVRITLLVCSKASRKGKFPLMIIGQARKLRAFKGKLDRNWVLIIGTIERLG